MGFLGCWRHSGGHNGPDAVQQRRRFRRLHDERRLYDYCVHRRYRLYEEQRDSIRHSGIYSNTYGSKHLRPFRMRWSCYYLPKWRWRLHNPCWIRNGKQRHGNANRLLRYDRGGSFRGC